MSIFEMTMLVCFGISWPVAIHKTWQSKNPAGKSIFFLYIVIVGYLAGCIHKIIYSFDPVFWLYLINTLMVITDLSLTLYYRANIQNSVYANLDMETKEL
jgi:hypothetical protein